MIARAMAFFRYTPAPPLGAFVQTLWWSYRPLPSPTREHMLTAGSAQLVITLHESPIAWADGSEGAVWHTWTRGVVHGPQSTFYRAGPKPAGAVMGVSFRPGAAGAILGVPMTELLDRHVTLEELWGARGLQLHEQLGSAGDVRSAFLLLERALIARLHRPLLMHPAVAHVLRESHKASRVEHLRERSGYSHRHFISLFRSAVGLTPKQFLRIQRFSAVVQQLAVRRSSGAELAAQFGYADQAHLTREFRELAGVVPTAYRPRASDSPLHHVAG